jgi:cysteine protease ATG4
MLVFFSIQSLFTFPQSVGIAGGRPSSSYYFIGTQANSLYYLDPHFTRPAVPLRSTNAGSEDSEQPRTSSLRGEVNALLGAFDPSELATFHCEKVKRMQVSGMDPSMLLGFMCKDEEDWLDLVHRVELVSSSHPTAI